MMKDPVTGTVRIDARHVTAVTTEDVSLPGSSERAVITVYLDSGAVIKRTVAGIKLADFIAMTLFPQGSDTKSWQSDAKGETA